MVMASKSAKEMTTNYSDVDVTRLGFTDLEENTRSKGQKIAYPRYDHPSHGSDSPLFIQFPWVNLNSYGIPRLGEFYSDDSQRAFVKIPLDQSIPEVKQFSELLQAIDEKLGSDEFKEKMFGAKASKYEYQPIYRLPQEEDEDAKKDPNKKDYGPRHPYMKLKIDTTYPENKVKSIVFTSVPSANGKRTRTKVDGISTVDDIASHICFMSKIRPIGRPVKLWAQAPNKKDPTFGLTFKMAKVEVEPPSKSNSNVKQYLESDAFLDSDDESETIETVKAVTTSKPVVTQSKTSVKQVAQVESDEESEQESEDESEEEVTKPAVKGKAPVKQVAQVESDEESDEEEVKPAKKPATKAAPKATGKTKKASA
jgi:hypothetical protein